MTDYEKVKFWLDRAEEGMVDITRDYSDWVHVGFACASLGEQGRELFQGFSSMYPGYSREECDKKFANLLSTNHERVGIGTLAVICQKYGIDTSLPKGPRKKKDEEKREKVPAIKQAEDYLNTLASFRYNILLEKVEYQKKDADGNPTGNWQPMDDRTYDTACTMLLNQGVKIQLNVVKTLINSRTFSPEYNPITVYLSSLKEWDGETDYIEQVFDFFEYDSPESRAFCMVFLKKWFVCMVALWMRKVEDNQIMPVLVGPQRIGKTLFCRIILPDALRKFTHTIYPGDRIDKDEIISLSENCLICFEEFDLVTKMFTNIIKAMISSTKSEKRRAFGHFAVNRNRLSSFIGNSNEEQYISHEEGDRRWISVKVKGSHDIKEHPLPIDEAYAQALWIVNNCSPEEYRPSREESMAISAFNDNFTKPQICEILVQKYYRAPKDNEPGEYIGMADIIETLNWKKDKDVNVTNIKKALAKLGIEMKHTNRGNKYHVFKLDLNAEREADKIDALNDFNNRQAEKESETLGTAQEQVIPF